MVQKINIQTLRGFFCTKNVIGNPMMTLQQTNFTADNNGKDNFGQTVFVTLRKSKKPVPIFLREEAKQTHKPTQFYFTFAFTTTHKDNYS